MGLLPKKTYADMMEELESLSWRIPESELGQIVDDLLALRYMLPSDERWGDVFESGRLEGKRLLGLQYSRGFTRYSRKDLKMGGIFNVAYGCNKCEKIIIGAPRLESVSEPGLLSGHESLVYFCNHCGSLIHEEIGKQY